jgi:NAD(P)-dependent dehydrogenase (short-subunit alcohol dehydrogenase family)
MEMSLHEYHGDDHPLFGLDALITQGHGQGFAQRLTRHGVRVIATSASDPLAAVTAVAAGQPLPEPLPHDHDHGHQAGPAQAHPAGARQIPVTLGK